MVRVCVELWTGLGADLGSDFQRLSDMRALLETEVDDGTTVRQLFQELARRYPAFREKLLRGDCLRPYLVATVNHRAMGAEELDRRVLEEGDVVTILPMYVGG